MPLPKAAAMLQARELVKAYLEHQQVPTPSTGTPGGGNAADFVIAMLEKLSAYFEKKD
jgi:hypothetical protein